jgi:hypothetical protein
MKAVVAAANASEKLTNNAKDLVTVFADKSE